MFTSTNLLLLWLCIALSASSAIDDSASSNDFSCNCEHCEGSKVLGIEDNDEDPEIDDGTTTSKNMYTEDFDGDGNRTICAADRDFEDRTFPSICHMLCYNTCTRYRILIYKVRKEKKYVASAFRTDFYKLRDGPC
ncbi:uncharacterized protein [Venturia canescens]|uniref:uncharacterized protein n=1 Tax=Venturia canescens TaxID=32260 RepID=UPI001C9CD7DB|nr:uncharacterized protein LOC122407491 [Venturia canescens]